jgi:hypothetical protein
MDEQGTIHERIHILKRDFPESQTKGFRKAVQKLQWDWEDWENAEPAEPGESKPTWSYFVRHGETWRSGIIPDLWFIDEECMSVICIEVEDRNPINTAKLNQYVRLWWLLDEMYWEIHLLCSDRWGNLTPVPITNFTAMGLAEVDGHRLANVIEAEREAKDVTFELTRIYANRNRNERILARKRWLEKNPGFGLRTNPEFCKKEFLVRRGLSAPGT